MSKTKPGKKDKGSKPSVKTCFDCKHLVEYEADDGNIGYQCDEFQREGDAVANGFNGLDEATAKAGCDDCINWTPKEAGDGPETFPTPEGAAATETPPATDAGAHDSEPIDPEIETIDQNDPRYIVLANERRDVRLREINAELLGLEDKQAACRREANGYKKPIADARAMLNRMISTDIHGFLAMEEEERKSNSLPLLDRAEDWKREPVETLDLPEKDREKLLNAGFNTCGDVAAWIARDWPEKKPGLQGKKSRERIGNAINKISGTDAQIEASLAENEAAVKTADATSEEQPVAGANPAKPTDTAWADEPAEKWFQLSKGEWTTVKKHFCTDTVVVGDLSNLQNALATGETKINGLGPAFLKKLEDQFLAFWEAMKKKTDEIVAAVLSETFYEPQEWEDDE